MRRFIPLLLGLLAVLSLGLPQLTSAAQQTRCFPTGYCVSGPILRYWEQNGGLPVFGYPITPQRVETIEGTWTGPVQWFERDRLEDHGAEGVLAGRLGARFLELQGIDWQQLPGDDSIVSNCRFFRETQLNVCQPFLGYWERNGGLARFGYPITRQREELIEGRSYQVQYFERRRMEYHPENAGTPYEVLLGLLGREVLNADTPAVCTTVVTPDLQSVFSQVGFQRDLGCPTAAYNTIPAAIENFEKGTMIWVDRGPNGKQIYVINRGITTVPVYTSSPDTWQEGEPVNAGLTPPPGVYEPQRGFGKLWRGPSASRSLRLFLGWATEPERAEQATVQEFTSGGVLIRLHGTNTVYAFGPNSDQVQIIRL